MSTLRMVSLGLGAWLLYLMYLRKKKHEEKLKELEEQSEQIWYKFMFVTNENSGCVEHLRQERPCKDKCSHNYLRTIRRHLRSAKVSISMCVYHVTLDSIFQELVRARAHRVKVRVIADREMAHHSASIMKKLIDRGIPVKIQLDQSSLMHHKFFLIDENTPTEEVWFGSLNLTTQGMTTNWDNMIYTNNPLIISKLSKCFNMLWESFDRM